MPFLPFWFSRTRLRRSKEGEIAMFDFASLERRLAALEANRGACLRFARVSTVQPDRGTARVMLEDGDGMVSYPLQVLFPRTGRDTVQDMPDVGDRVAVLFAGQGFEAGVVLGGCYSGENPAPGRDSDHFYRRFEDGTELTYDRRAHKLTATVRGDAEMEVTGRVTLAAEGAVSVRAQGALALESAAGISLTAPGIQLAGAVSSSAQGGGSGTFAITGRLDATGDMTAEGISLAQHTHTCPDGQTSGPQ